ncbi:MAG TPA: protein kinase [Opitutaceae bacterium]
MTIGTQTQEGSGEARRPAIIDFELIRLIGQGSYGDVWLARGITGVFRAVKVVWRDRFSDAHPFEREFKGLREFTAISLTESHQLALLHVGRNDEAGFFYYVMELADDAETGREIDPARYVPLTLREMRIRRGRLPAERCIDLAAELARALAGLHDRNLLHRDIKPSNVIIVGGVAKLADIGLVVSASDAHTFVGTEGFVPPEGPGAPAADVFSLGKLVYELSTGRDRNEFPSLPQDLDSIPDRKTLLELNEIVVRACDPSPTRRYKDAGAMLQDILLLQAGHSVRRLHSVERRLRDSLRLAAIMATIAAVAGGGAYIERKHLAAETERRQKAEAALENLARNAYYAATLSRAQRALESGNHGIARAILKEVSPSAGQIDLRDFEWRALWNEAQGDPSTVLSESGPALVRVHYSTDGKLVAGQDNTGTVAVWQVQSGRQMLHFRMPNAPVFAGFSMDNRWLLGVDEHYATKRWSVATGLPEETADKGPSRPLSPLGDNRVVCFKYDKKKTGSHHLYIWDFGTKTEITSWPIPHTGSEDGIFFSGAVAPDGATCAMALIFGRGRLATWRLVVMDLRTGDVKWDEALSNEPAAMAYGPDSHILACAFGHPDELRLLDLEHREWTWRTPVIGSPTAVSYLKTGVYCVGGRGRGLQLVAADSGRIVGDLRGQSGNISDLAADPETGQIASVSDTGELRIWSQETRSNVTSFGGFWNTAGGDRAVCLSTDGKLLAATLDGHRVQVVDTSGRGQRAQPIDGVIAPIFFTRDKSRLWTVCLDGSVQRWMLGANPEPDTTINVTSAGNALLGASGSLNGRWIVAYDNGGNLFAVDTEKKQLISRANAGTQPLFWVAVSGDGQLVAASGPQQFVGIWTLPDLHLKGLWHSDQWVTNGAFSTDSRTLAVTLKDGTVQFHQSDDPSRMTRRTTSSGTAYGLCFHPTEPRVFVGGQDGVLHVFNTNDWTEMSQMSAADPATSPGTIITEAASADGSSLAAYTESGLIRVWHE